MQLDWSTLALQTVNLLVLVWILARFFFRPVAAMVAKRQAEAKALLTDAAADRDAAAASRAEAAKALADLNAQRDDKLAEARAAAEAARTDLMDKAAAEAAKRRSDAEALIAQDRAAADQAIFDSAGALSVDIAKRLLARVPAAGVQSAFVDALLQAIEARVADASPHDEDVEIVSAAPLTKAQADRVRAAVAKAFGEETPCRFRADAALIAGVELHGRTVIILNSWRADLEAMRKELGGERHARQA